MDMISRIGLVVSAILCAGAVYLFFIPQSTNETSGSTPQLVNTNVREIEVPRARSEHLDGPMYEFSDQNHQFIFNASKRVYEERYATQHIGEGGFKTFEGTAIPHELKPLQLPFDSNGKYILLEGISENRVYQVVSETDKMLDLRAFDGVVIRLVKKQ